MMKLLMSITLLALLALPAMAESFNFPTPNDTFVMVYYPYWWNANDTVYGNRTVTSASVTHADCVLNIYYNSLTTGGHVDLDFYLGGTYVGTHTITESDGVGDVSFSYDFAPISGGTVEFKYVETNTVCSGCGSISMDEGLSTVDLTGTTATSLSDWSTVKALY